MPPFWWCFFCNPRVVSRNRRCPPILVVLYKTRRLGPRLWCPMFGDLHRLTGDVVLADMANPAEVGVRTGTHGGLSMNGCGCQAYCGRTKSCTTVTPWTPLFVGIYRGIESFQGFPGGTGFCPSTVAPKWKTHGSD